MKKKIAQLFQLTNNQQAVIALTIAAILTAFLQKDLMTDGQNKLTLEEKLAQRKYKPDFIPPPSQVIFTIDDKPIGTIQNFIVFSGLPKAGKSTFLAAAIASAFQPGDVFGMKVHFPEGRRKIAYFDTESSDFDFYRQINKIKQLF